MTKKGEAEEVIAVTVEQTHMTGYEIDEGIGLLRLISGQERMNLTIDEQVARAAERLEIDLASLNDDERRTVMNRLGVFDLYCSACGEPGRDILRDDEWLCPKHEPA